MTRRQAREHLFIMLFRKEFHESDELSEQLDLYLEPKQNLSEDDLESYEEGIKILKEKDISELKERFNEIVEKLPEIDSILSTISTGWDLNRMGKVDLTAMRIAVYEIKYDESIPDVVSINEAVEIAKKYGSNESSKLINGILGAIIRREE